MDKYFEQSVFNNIVSAQSRTVAVIASYLQSGSREWRPSGRPWRTNNLLRNTVENLSKTPTNNFVKVVRKPRQCDRWPC